MGRFLLNFLVSWAVIAAAMVLCWGLLLGVAWLFVHEPVAFGICMFTLVCAVPALVFAAARS